MNHLNMNWLISKQWNTIYPQQQEPKVFDAQLAHILEKTDSGVTVSIAGLGILERNFKKFMNSSINPMLSTKSHTVNIDDCGNDHTLKKFVIKWKCSGKFGYCQVSGTIEYKGNQWHIIPEPRRCQHFETDPKLSNNPTLSKRICDDFVSTIPNTVNSLMLDISFCIHSILYRHRIHTVIIMPCKLNGWRIIYNN